MDEEAAADGDPTGGPTYFEITTAMALVHFVEHQVDAAVLEVGLGGRLDSTNVCLPAVSVITSISFDHMQQLGNTLASIAREKAGIIKPGVPVVCGVTDPEPQAVIAEIAREHGCRLIQLGRDFRLSNTGRQQHGDGRSTRISTFDYVCVSPLANEYPSRRNSPQQLPLAMPGRHQAANAAVALATIAELRHQGWCISSDAMRAGSVAGRAARPRRNHAGRSDDRARHGPQSGLCPRTCRNTRRAARRSRRTLILSISHDKDVPAIVRELAPHFDRIIVTQYQENPRLYRPTNFWKSFGNAVGRNPIDVTVCAHAARGLAVCHRICGARRMHLHRRFVLPGCRDASAHSGRGRFGTARAIVPHPRLEPSLLANFVLQILDQLRDVRIGPRQHVASQRATRHASILQFRNR